MSSAASRYPPPLSGLTLWATEILLAMANLMAVLDTSIANVSVPNIAGALSASSSQGVWVITSYSVAEAIVVPLTGWLAGRFGTVRVFTAAMTLFGVFSALCGFSGSLEMLVFGRIMPAQAAMVGWNVAEGYLRRAWVVMALLAGADYGVQRFRYMQGLKMTHQEVKEESRMTEGSPEIKARVRKAQRQLLRKRMLANVKTATVVVTNPHGFHLRPLDLLAPPPVDLGVFDLVVEIYTVQAMSRSVRPDVVAAVRRLLAPGGTLLVVQARLDANSDLAVDIHVLGVLDQFPDPPLGCRG